MQDTLTTTDQEIKQEALTIVEQAKVKIIDQRSYDYACDVLLNRIKPFRARWTAYWKGENAPVTLAYRAYKSVLGKFTEGDEPLEQAERLVKSAILKWDQEQERIRQELQRKAEEEARQREEEERLRAATLAEETGASKEEVEAIVNTPAVVVAPPVQPTYQKASGVSSRENWKAKVTDMKKLCAAIGKGLVPVTYVLPNESVLNARAKADRQTLNIPGVAAYNEPIVSGRSK
jgi:hypothetical protein